jgi:hypothetical protein
VRTSGDSDARDNRVRASSQSGRKEVLVLTGANPRAAP